MSVIYWVVLAVSIIYAGVLLYAVIKIWRLLEEVINAGSINAASNNRVKDLADEAILQGYTAKPEEIEHICQSLAEMTDDPEAKQMIKKLRALDKVGE